VFRTAYRITGNVADAEDVLQNVFLKLLRREATAEEIRKPESYLRRAAVNASLDLVRARTATGELEPERLRTSGSCTDLGELRDSLRQALSKLPPRSAEMFALRFFEGHSNPEIARMLGVSQLAVAVTVHRARRKLQQELEKQSKGARK